MAFWLLLLSMIVQSIVYADRHLQTLAGEWIVFMILCLYLAVACVKKGIWDRKIPMTGKANLLLSLIAGAAVGLFNAAVIFRNYQQPLGILAAALITAIFSFLFCFAALTLLMRFTQKRFFDQLSLIFYAMDQLCPSV